MNGERILKVSDVVIGSIAAGVVLALTTGVAQAQYSPGFVWDRQVDWSGGQVAGSTLGNPDDDALGNPVWLYETWDFTQFGQGTVTMTWDPSWFGSPSGVWNWSDDSSPLFFTYQATQAIHDGALWRRQPKVTWISPNLNTTRVDVAGTLTVVWDGAGGVGSPIAVTVLIRHFDPDGDFLATLFSEVVDKPIPEDSIGDTLLLPVSFSLDVEFGDRIEFKHGAVGQAGDPFGNFRWIDLVDNITIIHAGETGVGVDESTGRRVQGLVLHQNAPNPFSSTTRISFALPRSGPVQLGIYDASGRLVRGLLDMVVDAGHHVVPWSGVDDAGQRLPVGVYFYRLAVDGRTETKKAILLK